METMIMETDAHQTVCWRLVLIVCKMFLSYSQSVRANAETELYRFLMERSVMMETTLMVTGALETVSDLSLSSVARFLEKVLELFVITITPVILSVEMAKSTKSKVNSVTTETMSTGMGAVERTVELSPCGYAGRQFLTISREPAFVALSKIQCVA